MTPNTVPAKPLPSPSRNTSAKRTTTAPRNWPPNLPYLTHPQHSPLLTPAQLTHLHTPPSPSPSPSSPSPTIPTFPLPSHPNPSLAITPITHPAHPAHAQHGLFATTPLPAGTLICLYLGRVHSDSAQDTDARSDYDISLSRSTGAEEAGIGIDAARAGNEGRFVNDFRGVRAKGSRSGEGPNAEFRDVWMECVRGGGHAAGGREGERGIGIFVLPAGRSGRRRAGIRAGEEVLVSYGRGFWENRRPSTEDGVEGGDG